MRFTNKRVLLTGASSGIGREIATRLAGEGAFLYLTGRDPDRLQETESEIRASGGAAEMHPADLARENQVQDLATAVEKRASSLDFLVHAAGVIELDASGSTEIESFARQSRINLAAPHQLTRALLPSLKRSRGQVVFLNSTAALSPSAGTAGYAASKAGLRALADALRQEVNADGVRVLSLFLGRTATPMQEAIQRHEGRDYAPERLIQPADVAAMVSAVLALPPTAEVTELRMRPAMKPE